MVEMCSNGMFRRMSIATPLALEEKVDWNVVGSHKYINLHCSVCLMCVSCKKIMSPDKDFKWEKIFPLFKPVLRPLTFQLRRVIGPGGEVGELLATIKAHYLYLRNSGILTVLIMKIRVVLFHNKRAGKKEKTTNKQTTYTVNPSPRPLPQTKQSIVTPINIGRRVNTTRMCLITLTL